MIDHRTLIAELQGGLNDPESKTLANGAVLIGRLPHVAPKAFLHELYPPLPESVLMIQAGQQALRIPPHAKEFLAAFNGLLLYRTTLWLGGIRVGLLSRDPDDSQPFHLDSYNGRHRTPDTLDDDFIIGGYNWDGSLLFMEGQGREVLRRRADRRVVLNRWPDIWTMIEMEVARIRGLFDSSGNQKDPDSPTTPIVAEAVISLNRRE